MTVTQNDIGAVWEFVFRENKKPKPPNILPPTPSRPYFTRQYISVDVNDCTALYNKALHSH